MALELGVHPRVSRRASATARSASP